MANIYATAIENLDEEQRKRMQAQAQAQAAKQAANMTANQAGIAGAAGVGGTVAGAIPMASNGLTDKLAGAAQNLNAYQKLLETSTPPIKATNTVNITSTNRNSYSGDAIDPATAAKLGTPQPAVQNKDYLFFGRTDPGFKLGMSDADRASWDAIGAKYAAGDTSWNRDTNQFRENGNWSGYYDDNGNYNGWLRAVNGTGGYAPAFGGKVGETGYSAGTVFYAPDGTAYTMGADGGLTKSGNVTLAQYGSYIGPSAGYQDSDFWALEDGQYKRYTNQTAPQEVLNAQGYYRDANGLVMPIDQQYREAQARQNGDVTPEQLALAQAMAKQASDNGIVPPQTAQNTPQPVQPSVNNSGSASRSSTTRETTPTNYQPTQPTQNTQPVQAAPPISNAPAQLGQNAYQRYLDQWDYPDAPEWNGTDYERQRDELLANAMNPYEGSPYDQQRDDALAQYGEKWQGSEYQPKRDEALRRAEEMQWNYDPNTDPVWQALQKQYRREGDRATQEAMAQAAMRTGGLANSYAVTAASQAGDYYAAQLSDRLPQLYQDAYQRYLQEFQRQMGISDQYQGFDDREYSRWMDQQGKNLDLADRYNQYGQQDYNRYMDRVSQQLSGADRYNNYGGTEYQRYLDQLGQYNTDRNFSYGRYRDAVGDYRYDDETQYNRAWNEEARDYNRAYQAQRDAILDNRADREWAQQLREYADAQNWKATEWEQYLREYGDQLSEQERQWAYQMARDAESDRRYNDETAYQRAMYADETAYDRGYKQTVYQNELSEADDKRYKDGLSLWSQLGVLPDRYADIVGYPAGTRWEDVFGGMDADEAYSGGGNPGYTPSPKSPSPSDTPPIDAPPGDNPPDDTTPDNTGNGRTWWNGRPMTDTAYDLQSRIAYGWAQKTLTKDNVQRMVYDAARKGYIEDYEIPLLMRIIGVNIQGPSQQNPNVEGPITQWTK